MTTPSAWKAAVLTAAAFVALVPMESEASKTKSLTVQHTSYGVSQFNYGNIASDAAEPIRLMNPTGVTQAAAVFLYTRNNPLDPNTAAPEIFVGCAVELLTPHASVVIPRELLDVAGVCGNATTCPGYAEVIWAPSDGGKGRKHARQLSDGLGGRADAGAGQPPFQLAHPSLFTPPEAADLDVARACIAESLDDLGLRQGLFDSFFPERRHNSRERRRGRGHGDDDDKHGHRHR